MSSSLGDVLAYLCQSSNSERWKHLSSILESEGIRSKQDFVGLGEVEMNLLEFNLGEKIRFRRYQVVTLLERLNNLDVSQNQKNAAIRILNQSPHLVPSWCMLEQQDLTALVIAHGPDSEYAEE